MRKLFSTALKNKANKWLLAIIVASMILATFASQMEFFALSLITNKGPEFFDLFPAQNGATTWETVQHNWVDITGHAGGVLTKDEAISYIAKDSFLNRMIYQVNKTFDLTHNLPHLAIFLIAIALFKAITMFMNRFFVKLASISISRDLRQSYFEHIQSLPMSFYQKHNMGSLSSRVVGDSAMVAQAVNACLVNYIETPFMLISTLTVCFLTSWQLSLIVFLGFPMIVFPITFLSKRVKRIAKQIQQNQENFASVLLDFIGGIQTVKVFAMEEFSLKKYQEHNDQMATLERKSAKYDLSTRPIVHTVAMMFLAVTMIYGLYVLQMSISEILFYCCMLYLFYEPIKKFAEENSHIQRGIAATERMHEVLALNPQIQDEPGALDQVEFQDQIEFEDVWFKYNEEWVLKGLSFTVKKGQTVAIVGPTGSGKSTIVQLLPRLYDVQKGEIRKDGKPLKAYTQKSLRQSIAFVPQRPFLFLDTVAANIAYGEPYSLEQIQGAAVQAHADEFICRMPLNYQTELSEAGKNLSGGQQQRLAIARALVKNAPILVMDEATSSLDAVSENHIKSAIQNLHGKVTQILIAHRFSTIEHADKIIYLEHGQKIAEGTKDELLKSCEGFKRMWELMRLEGK